MEAIKNVFSNRKIRAETTFKRFLVITALSMMVIALSIFITLVIHSVPSFKALGPSFFWSKTWDPVNNIYGALPFLLGTLITSFLALLISIPFSYAIAIYLGEYKTTGWISGLLKNIVELVAAVPSVIYGFWALVVLVPIVREIEIKAGIALWRGHFNGIACTGNNDHSLCCLPGAGINTTGAFSLKGRCLFTRCNAVRSDKACYTSPNEIRIICGFIIISRTCFRRNNGGNYGNRKYQ